MKDQTGWAVQLYSVCYDLRTTSFSLYSQSTCVRSWHYHNDVTYISHYDAIIVISHWCHKDLTLWCIILWQHCDLTLMYTELTIDVPSQVGSKKEIPSFCIRMKSCTTCVRTVWGHCSVMMWDLCEVITVRTLRGQCDVSIVMVMSNCWLGCQKFSTLWIIYIYIPSTT